MIQTEKLALLHCTHACTKNSFVEFKHEGLQEQLKKLQSSVSQGLVKEMFADLFEGVEGLESATSPVVNKTAFNNPPLPQTEEPGNPCDDPFSGAPSTSDKNTKRCTLAVPGNCYRLNERFLLIQAGIQDERDELKDEIAGLEHLCEETKIGLEGMISDDETMLDEAQKKLALATEKEA